MKKEKISATMAFLLQILAIIIIIFLRPTGMLAQKSDCDFEKTQKDYNNGIASSMPTWPGRDSVMSGSEYVVKYYNDTITVRLGTILVAAIRCVRGTDAKIITSKGVFLEIRTINSDKKNKSFFFVKGTEIRKLVTGIKDTDYFSVKEFQDEFLFEFANNDYARYRYDNRTFNLCKKP
ncbi:MAG: hypothetical protein WCG28_04695 [bacterium]